MATILNDAAYMALPMNIKRGNPIPLDTTAVWYSKTELETYAQSGATAYVGQVLALVEDGKCEAYMISSESGTLVKLAQTTASGDLASDVATLQGKVDSLVDKVGSAAQGETAATGLYALIATAQAQADKGVTNAANAQTTAEAAQSDVNALKTTVGADDENGLRARIKANETAISGINTKIGTVTEGKTIVEMIADAKTAATYDDAEVKASIQSNKSAIDTLNGDSNVDGSVDKKVTDAINDFATKVSADGTINTFKELIDYAASHTSEYSELSGEVQKNTTAIATLNGAGAGSVAKTVEDAVEPVIARISTLEGKVTDGKIAQWDAAQANVIESIKLNGTAIDIAADKSVNIAIPAATSEALGLAQADGSTIEATDGVLSVKAVGISKVFVEDGVELVMNGGNA